MRAIKFPSRFKKNPPTLAVGVGQIVKRAMKGVRVQLPTYILPSILIFLLGSGVRPNKSVLHTFK